MSAYNYGPIKTTAVGLIYKFGRNVTLVTETKGGTAYAPTITTTTSTIRGVITSFKSNEIDGTLIQANDKVILSDSEIKTQNKITIGSETYSVLSVTVVSPADMPIIYKGHLRK